MAVVDHRVVVHTATATATTVVVHHMAAIDRTKVLAGPSGGSDTKRPWQRPLPTFSAPLSELSKPW